MVRLRTLISSFLLPAALALTNEPPVLVDTPISTTSASSYTLYHRVYNPTSGPSTWAVRGEANLISDGTSEWQAGEGEALDVRSSGEDAWYQVALGSDKEELNTKEARYGMSSVRLCHLQSSPNLTLSVRLDRSPTPTPKSIHLSLASSAGVPKDGRCQGPIAFDRLPKTELSVQLVRPEVLEPISPQTYTLNSPSPNPNSPPLDPQTGKPQAVVKEKTFLQKYWVYLFCGVMVFAMMSGEEPQKKGAVAGK